MNKSILTTAIIMLVIGLSAGWWLADNSKPSSISQAAHEANSGQRKPLFYRNPMNPEVTSPVPAQDSMGMDYIPVYADGGPSSDVLGTVKIDPTIVQNIGVRTAIAKRSDLSRTVRAVGRIDFNEQAMTRLHPKVEGWIESILIDKTGDKIKMDEILLNIYSPQLVSSQQEYLLALNNLEATAKSDIPEIVQGSKGLVKSARERLRLLDVPEHQIHELEKTREIKKSLHIHSPIAGTVIHIGARKGQFVSPKTELYMIVDLSEVWVYADIYEYELPWVKQGDTVEMTLVSVPGKTFTGSLEYIYPYSESKTRTTKVRMVFDNTDRLLRPDMFADVQIKSDTQRNVVVIPSEAVVRSGNQTQVFVLREPGKFEPRIVKLGIESNGQVVVIEGIDPGEIVVTSAQFLIDSESKLREATAKMLESMSDNASSNNGASPDDDAMDHSSMNPDPRMDSEKAMDQSTMQGEHNHD